MIRISIVFWENICLVCLPTNFRDPAMTSFRRPRNLKDNMVRTRLDNPLPNGGFKTCTNLKYQLYKYSSYTEGFSSPVTGRSYKILGIFCKTNNCICEIASAHIAALWEHGKTSIFVEMVVAERANAWSSTVLLGGGCRRSHVRPQVEYERLVVRANSIKLLVNPLYVVIVGRVKLLPHSLLIFLRTHAMYISQFFFLSPTLKTSNDDKILENPRVIGNTETIQSFSFIQWWWKYIWTTIDSVFVVSICTGAVYFFSSKRGNSGKLYMNNCRN
jgi:hypothetical protein